MTRSTDDGPRAGLPPSPAPGQSTPPAGGAHSARSFPTIAPAAGKAHTVRQKRQAFNKRLKQPPMMGPAPSARAQDTGTLSPGHGDCPHLREHQPASSWGARRHPGREPAPSRTCPPAAQGPFTRRPGRQTRREAGTRLPRKHTPLGSQKGARSRGLRAQPLEERHSTRVGATDRITRFPGAPGWGLAGEARRTHLRPASPPSAPPSADTRRHGGCGQGRDGRRRGGARHLQAGRGARY